MTVQEAIVEQQQNIDLPWGCNISDEASELAIEALEKQIPKKPIEYEDKYYGCPSCDNPLMEKWKKYPTELKPKSDGLPFCLGCGQAVDWEEGGNDDEY